MKIGDAISYNYNYGHRNPTDPGITITIKAIVVKFEDFLLDGNLVHVPVVRFEQPDNSNWCGGNGERLQYLEREVLNLFKYKTLARVSRLKELGHAI